MSEIIKLQNGLYEFKIPPPPSREEDILFINEKKKDQYWRTPARPDFRRMNIREKVKYIDTDRQRWAEGVHFMNNGELTYINGLHWDHLVHMTFGGKKAFYLDNQRLDFYFRQLTWEHPMCKGRVIAKGRRVGASMEELTEATYRSMHDFIMHIALVSIEERKTKKTLFNPIVDSFVKRIKHMRPAYYKPNGKKPKQELKLSSDDIALEDDINGEIDRLELEGWIVPFPTSVSALDGYLINYASCDEVWKWTAASPLEFLETSLPCFDDGGKKIGIISLLSTLGDTDDVKKAVEDGVYIYRNSDPRNLTEDGYTKTGLWKWFISAVFAEREMRDLYGKINVDQATEKILKERAKHEEGSQAWTHAVRRKPLTEEEAMATAYGSTTFDNIRLEKRITFINSLPVSSKPYVVGNLVEDTVSGNVHFERDDKGFWQIAIHPKKDPKSGEDRSNRWYKDDNDILHWSLNPEGVVGYDPIRYGDKQTKSSNVSQSAIICRYKFDYFGNADKFGRSCAGRYAGLYHNRDEDPDTAHSEFLKACKYWGFLGMYERQVEAVLKFVKEMMAIAVLMKHKGKYGIWTDNQRAVIKKGIDRFQSLIKRPQVGMQDKLQDIPFERLLAQAKKLDPANTREADIFMANTMLEIGEEMLVYLLVPEEHEHKNFQDYMKGFTVNDNTLVTLFAK